MRRVIHLMILGIAAAAWALAADPKWIQLENENFHIYSSAGARETRSALNYFERIRSFFLQLTGAPPAKPVPVYIVAFGTEKEYQPYRLNEFAIAYYHGQAERDYIVLGRMGEQAEHVAAHEYAHLVFRHAGYRLPPWLNEGLAELFSTVTEIGNDTVFGRPIPGRLAELQTMDWVPLKTILEADQSSPYYNESKRAGNLYNEGWALVHMLTTTNEYRQKFGSFFGMVQAGTPSAEALEKAYGQPFAKIEEALRFYIQGGRFNEMLVKIQLDDIEKLAVSPADSFDVRYVQGDLLLGLKDHRVEGLRRMEDLARENPSRPEPQSSLAYVMWQDGKQEEAVQHFSSAFAGGARTPKLLWDFARLAMRSKPDQVEQALAELIKLEPKNTDYRLFLANLQTQQKEYAGALATLKDIKEVPTVEIRDSLLYQRAALAMNLGDRAEAQARAEELKRLTKSEDFANRADQLLAFLQQPATREFALSEEDDDEPEEKNADGLARNEVLVPVPERPKDSEPKKPVIVLQTVTGMMVEFQCDNPPRMVLETEQGRKNFVVLQPDRLIVTGTTGGAEFSCGPQKPAKQMRLQFSETPEGTKADGVVRAIHFGE